MPRASVRTAGLHYSSNDFGNMPDLLVNHLGYITLPHTEPDELS